MKCWKRERKSKTETRLCWTESRPNALLGGNDGVDRSASATSAGGAPSGATLSVEEFVPDGGIIDRSFLEDSNVSSPSQSQAQAQASAHQDSDSEDDLGVNPLVAGFEDDIDSADEAAPVAPVAAEVPAEVAPAPKALHSPKNVLVNPNAVDNATRKSSTSSVSSLGAKGAPVDDEWVFFLGTL